MPIATFRFYAELNDFLPPAKRKVDFTYEWHGADSIKHLIEAIGVPHTEVDLILVNGASVDFAYHPHDGDRISVYPVFESLDVASVTHLRPRPLRDTKFVLDGHLGRLAAYLRMLGFDTWCRTEADDETLARVSQAERRNLLTRDHGLLKRSLVTHGYYVRSNLPRDQLREVIERFDLQHAVQPFTRCLVCNGRLQAVAIDAIRDQLLPDTVRHYQEFWRCDQCGKVYWRGPHYRRMAQLAQDVLTSPSPQPISFAEEGGRGV
jgi:uncharacterized protein with PIN domain